MNINSSEHLYYKRDSKNASTQLHASEASEDSKLSALLVRSFLATHIARIPSLISQESDLFSVYRVSPLREKSVVVKAELNQQCFGMFALSHGPVARLTCMALDPARCLSSGLRTELASMLIENAKSIAKRSGAVALQIVVPEFSPFRPLFNDWSVLANESTGNVQPRAHSTHLQIAIA